MAFPFRIKEYEQLLNTRNNGLPSLPDFLKWDMLENVGTTRMISMTG